MKRAILSDIHANLAALEVAIEDIKAEGVDKVYCLGDVIGYGPDPRQCLEFAQQFPVNLLGNHEEAVLVGAIGFNPKAKAAIDWTRDQLNLDSEPIEKNREFWNFLGRLKRTHIEERLLFVHGSPREPTREYLFSQDHHDRKKMDEVFAAPPGVDWRVCFTGHTHYPGIFTQENPYKFYDPKSTGGVFAWKDLPHRIIVNVGSVGQPRDGDYRVCYVVMTDDELRFKRLDYDVHRTIARFEACPALPEYLARRLEEGK